MKNYIFILGMLFTGLVMNSYAQMHSEMEGKYYFAATVKGELMDVKQKTEEVFKEEGFGLISEIPMHEKLEEKLEDVDVKPYYIMGFCNPAYAYKTLQLEENIGLFLPCKVIVRDNGNGTIDVVAIDPEKAMQTIGNNDLNDIAGEVTKRFKAAIEALPAEL